MNESVVSQFMPTEYPWKSDIPQQDVFRSHERGRDYAGMYHRAEINGFL